MKSYKVIGMDENNNPVFEENELNADKKAKELINKFNSHEFALKCCEEILDVIKQDDNRMYYEIKFWKEVKEKICI